MPHQFLTSIEIWLSITLLSCSQPQSVVRISNGLLDVSGDSNLVWWLHYQLLPFTWLWVNKSVSHGTLISHLLQSEIVPGKVWKTPSPANFTIHKPHFSPVWIRGHFRCYFEALSHSDVPEHLCFRINVSVCLFFKRSYIRACSSFSATLSVSDYDSSVCCLHNLSFSITPHYKQFKCQHVTPLHTWADHCSTMSSLLTVRRFGH